MTYRRTPVDKTTTIHMGPMSLCLCIAHIESESQTNGPRQRNIKQQHRALFSALKQYRRLKTRCYVRNTVIRMTLRININSPSLKPQIGGNEIVWHTDRLMRHHVWLTYLFPKHKNRKFQHEQQSDEDLLAKDFIIAAERAGLCKKTEQPMSDELGTSLSGFDQYLCEKSWSIADHPRFLVRSRTTLDLLRHGTVFGQPFDP